MQRQRFSFLGWQCEKSVAFSMYSPSARSGGTQQEVYGSTSSALRVASMFKTMVQNENEDEMPLPTSALAMAASVASISSTPFGFITRIGDSSRLLSSPSIEFLALALSSFPYARRSFTKEQQAETTKIARTLALACVMDQRSVLLQQSSWQRGVHIDKLVDQVRGPLMAIRTLGKMLLPHLKRGEISRDVVEDILVQSNRMDDVVHQPQKSGGNSPQFSKGFLEDLKGQTGSSKIDIPGEANNFQEDGLARGSSHGRQRPTSFSALGRDEESPMPSLALAAPPLENTKCSCQ